MYPLEKQKINVQREYDSVAHCTIDHTSVVLFVLQKKKNCTVKSQSYCAFFFYKKNENVHLLFIVKPNCISVVHVIFSFLAQ